MSIGIFLTCSGCMNKQSLDNLRKGTYYCPLVAHIVPGGIVHYDTDATECIQNGIYRNYPIYTDTIHKQSNNKNLQL